MASRLDIELTPEAKKLINDLSKVGVIDFRPTLAVIGIGYRKEVNLIFNKKQVRTEAERWAPLSAGYAIRKSLAYPNAPLLVRTGTLKKSMVEKGASGNIEIIKKDSAIFGSSIRYGIYHDSDAARTKMPRRNFSEPSQKRADIWKSQIEKDIRRHFEKNGIKFEGAVLK